MAHIETPGYNMAVTGAYILFDERGGEFAFDCHGLHPRLLQRQRRPFGTKMTTWSPSSGDGWAKLQDDRSLEGDIWHIAATISHSSHVAQILLQQPARPAISERPTTIRSRMPRARRVDARPYLLGHRHGASV